MRNSFDMKLAQELWEQAKEGCSFLRPKDDSSLTTLVSADYMYITREAYKALGQLISYLASPISPGGDLNETHIRELVLLRLGNEVWHLEYPETEKPEPGLESLIKLFEQRFREKFFVVGDLPHFVIRGQLKFGSISLWNRGKFLKSGLDAIPVTSQRARAVCTFEVNDNPVILGWTGYARRVVQRLIDIFWLWARSLGRPAGISWRTCFGFADVFEYTYGDLEPELTRQGVELETAERRQRIGLRVLCNIRTLNFMRSVGIGYLEDLVHVPEKDMPEGPRRLFTAASWYNRAWKAGLADQTIVNCCVALESLFGAKGYAKARELARLCHLCAASNPYGRVDAQQVSESVLKLYKVRNAIVHDGWHPETRSWRYHALYLVEKVALGYAILGEKDYQSVQPDT